MRVLLLTWDFPPGKGGIQIWMHELARRLPDAQVRVLAPAAPGDRAFDAAAGIHVQRLASAHWSRASWLAELTTRTLATCLTWRPDLIVCGHVITAPAALAARRLTGVPYAVFTYGYEIRRKRRRRWIARLLHGARSVIAISQFTREAVLALGVTPERIRILYPGVDADRFSPTTDHRPPTTNHRPPTLLSVSRLADMYKGHDTTIRALPLVRAKVPGARYVVAGGGPLREYLGRVAQSVGVERDVEFLGEVPDDALVDLYRSADVLAVLSRESASVGGAEGFGIVCLEAAACGVPVVAGRSGGLVDAVQDGVTGILVDPLDLGAAAEAIVVLLGDPDRARRMGAAGRAAVLDHFTWDHMAREARRLFEKATR
jgi:phosphatidylinositol alpha-1,6-mannosyltransferase